MYLLSNPWQNLSINFAYDFGLFFLFFSVVDVISALTDSNNPRDYWYKLKIRMTEVEKSELSSRCQQLKMIEHIKSNPRITQENMATEVGLSIHTIKKNVGI